MEEVRFSRFRVRTQDASAFEDLAREQSQRMHGAAQRVAVYVFIKRTGSSERLPAMFTNPHPGTTEYLHLAAALDNDGEAQLATQEAIWRPAVENLLSQPAEVETIEQPAFVAGISRNLVWTPDSIAHCNLYRMRVRENPEELQAGLLRMMRRVVDEEPDPPLYAAVRRHDGGSTLLPHAPVGQADYLRFHVYQSTAGLDLHNDRDREWWSAFYQPRLVGTLECLYAEALAGFTRDHLWGAAETSAAPV